MTEARTYAPKSVLAALVSRVQAWENCTRWIKERPESQQHYERMAASHRMAADYIANEFLPSGSGFDAGTSVDWAMSKGDSLVLMTSFHHMNDVGMYDGWTEHLIKVVPCYVGFPALKITGRNRNDIKSRIDEEIGEALCALIVETGDERAPYQRAEITSEAKALALISHHVVEALTDHADHKATLELIERIADFWRDPATEVSEADAAALESGRPNA
jgi:hypothetical protein